MSACRWRPRLAPTAHHRVGLPLLLGGRRSPRWRPINKLGLPVVWGAVLPDITYRNKFAEMHRVNGTMINQNEIAAKFMADLGSRNGW